MDPPKTFASKEEEHEYMWKHLMGPVDGIFLPPKMPWVTSWQERIDNLRQMKLREDDVILLTYPKSGTHWLWEVITMLRKKTSEPDAHSKVVTMMEFIDVEVLNQQPSPRTLNAHLPFCLLPAEEMKTRPGIKGVHVYRNPKDAAVSLYHMVISSPRATGPLPTDSFHDFVEFYFFGNKQICGSYFYYLRQMDEFQRQNPHIPFFNLAFEDVKKDPVKCVKQLAQFLELDVSEELCAQIAEACSFEKMKQQQTKKVFPKLSEKWSEENKLPAEMPVIYRKGQIGDWKNYFSVADNERVDALVEREMKDIPYTLTFE